MSHCNINVTLKPIPMVLKCPTCNVPHVDAGEWTTIPHREHLCAACGHRWRPANVHTVGVPELPACGIIKHEDMTAHLVSITLVPSTWGR